MSAEKPTSYEEMIGDLKDKGLISSEEDVFKSKYETAPLSRDTQKLEPPSAKAVDTGHLEKGALRKIINQEMQAEAESEPQAPVEKDVHNQKDWAELKGSVEELNDVHSKNYNPGLWRTVMKQFRDFIKGKEKK